LRAQGATARALCVNVGGFNEGLPPVALGSFKRLGSTAKRRSELVPEPLEFAARIRRSRGDTGVDRPAFELIADVAWEEMHVQVGRRVAVNFVIHLHRMHDPGDCGGHRLDVLHERGALGLGQVMKLNDIFSRSDYVVVVVPLNKETFHMIGAEQFKLMKKTAFFINVCRGSVVNEPDLVQALKEKWFAAAGLDVFEKEPADPKNPLFALDNVIVAPHSICHTDECFRLILDRKEAIVDDFRRRMATRGKR